MNRKTLAKRFTMALAIALVFSAQVFAAEITITGRINDMYQIVTDTGKIYEVADNDLADEMLENVGKAVKVTGTLIEDDEEVKTILVTEYEIIENQ